MLVVQQLKSCPAPPDWRPFLEIYDMFIAISRWNEAYLKSLNIAPVHLCHQGVDTTLFCVGPRIERWPGRFVIFSGGKFEFRKGQDIVLAAFKIFHARHSDALLVTSWQNARKADAIGFSLAGHISSVPESSEAPGGINIANWLISQGLLPESFIDLPRQPNMAMPAILKACDIALFS
jgi:glycosyltransferase involved in cell wall biosynthesis